MSEHVVRVYPSSQTPPIEEHLAHKMAVVATGGHPLSDAAIDMAINRVIDNASVAVASLNRGPVVTARAMAIAHPRAGGATVFGLPNDRTVSPEWAAWANGTAVRELDFHDTYLAADYSHPGDNIPPLLAVAQQTGRDGAALLRGILTAYELHVALVRGICLHEHKIDHIAHTGPAGAAGLGAMLGLDTQTTWQAIQQTLHTTTTTRQSRKGLISSWKAFAPAFSSKMAIEAVDRCMRGEGAPTPIYEGEDGVIAWLLDGPDAEYRVLLPDAGEPLDGILETYTKEHSAEYQSQALIDLAFKMRERVGDWDEVEDVLLETSHHTHYVIGTGANDPQKMDPEASRETLDHSIMYILAVALQDGRWHHVDSYAPERAQRPDTVRLWHKIRTVEDPRWTARYHSKDPAVKAFGGKLRITLRDGTVIEDELAVANAHTLGARPFQREQYVQKFRTLAEGIVPAAEQDRFLSLAARLPELTHDELRQLDIEVPIDTLQAVERDDRGIF